MEPLLAETSWPDAVIACVAIIAFACWMIFGDD